MLSEIHGFSKQFAYALGHYPEIIPDISPESIVVAGMGGSALPADLINDYLALYAPPKTVRISRDYLLPSDVGPKTLVICSSYSGNTEETLEALKQALSKKCPIIVLTHGGKLRELAIKHQLPLIEIPNCIQPRCAVGYFFSAMLLILQKCGWVSGIEGKLNRVERYIEKVSQECERIGQTLATSLKGYLPLLYGPSAFEALLRIFKIKFNENAKIQAFYNVYPELNHNEMVGFTQLITKPAIVHIKSQFMHPRIQQRMAIMQQILGDKIVFFDVTLKGADYIEELFYAHLVADYTSYYLAAAYGVDPAPVEMVETFKKQLN